MKDENQMLLDEVIEKELKNLDSFATGTKEKSDAISDVIKLYGVKIEEEKAKQEKRDKIFNIALQVALTGASLIAYNAWYNRGLKFQETGSFTDPMTRNLLSRMLPGKK